MGLGVPCSLGSGLALLGGRQPSSPFCLLGSLLINEILTHTPVAHIEVGAVKGLPLGPSDGPICLEFILKLNEGISCLGEN